MSQTSKPETHTVEIIINTRPYEVPKGELTFEALAELAYPGGGGQNVLFTITYRNGHGNKSEGSLDRMDGRPTVRLWCEGRHPRMRCAG